jgi:hypothetical protein
LIYLPWSQSLFSLVKNAIVSPLIRGVSVKTKTLSHDETRLALA